MNMVYYNLGFCFINLIAFMILRQVPEKCRIWHPSVSLAVAAVSLFLAALCLAFDH